MFVTSKLLTLHHTRHVTEKNKTSDILNQNIVAQREHGKLFYKLITVRIRRMGEGNIFSLCVSSHPRVVHPSADRGGTSSKVRMGGKLFPGQDGGTPFPGHNGGTPSQVTMGGTSFQVRMGVPLPRSGWGYLLTWDLDRGFSHPNLGWGTPIDRMGVPRSILS